MEPTVVFRSLNVNEAELVASRLESAGFSPAIQNELNALPGCAMKSAEVTVEVPGEEAAEVKAFLAGVDTDVAPQA